MNKPQTLLGVAALALVVGVAVNGVARRSDAQGAVKALTARFGRSVKVPELLLPLFPAGVRLTRAVWFVSRSRR